MQLIIFSIGHHYLLGCDPIAILFMETLGFFSALLQLMIFISHLDFLVIIINTL